MVDNISIIGSHANTRLAETQGIKIDFVNTQLGVAYHRSLQKNTDLIADISYVRTELVISNDTRSASRGDGSGYKLGAGVRHQLSDRIELHSSLDYLSVESGTDTALTVGGRYYFTHRFSAGAGYTTGDFDGITGSLRLNF